MAVIHAHTNRKKFKTVGFQTYTDFARNTSIHGMPLTVKDTVNIYEKIFWMLLILVSVTGAGYMTVLFWSRYTSNPTRTSIVTDYAPTTAVPFPAVTICNINRIMVNQVEDFVKQLKMPQEQVELVKRALPHLLSFLYVSPRKYNRTELDILQKILTNNEYTDVATVMKKIAQPCHRLLVKCSWEFQVVPCKEIFYDSDTTDGLCCSFNYVKNNLDRKPLHTPFNGFNSGLKLLMNPEIQAVQYSMLHSTGVKVLIHSSRDYPGQGFLYKTVSPGTQTSLSITASKIISSPEVRNLPIDQRQCVYSKEVKLKYFNKYSTRNCVTECLLEYFIRTCGCVPFYFALSKHSTCNTTDIPCLSDSIVTSKSTTSCNCPSQCQDLFYSVHPTSVTMVASNNYTTSSFLTEASVTDDSILLYIHFSGLQNILMKDTVTSTIYLLSSYGGVYSLFLGCSFISVIEVAYYLTFRLAVNLKMLRRAKKIDAGQNERNKLKQVDITRRVWAYERNIFLH